MLLYLLKFSISLAVLYIFYRAVLRPLTFYQWNRFYLLCYSLLSFIIPFIDISAWLTANPHPQLVNMIPAIGYYRFAAVETEQRLLLQRLTLSDWMLLVFCTGAVLMLVKLLRQYSSLRSIRQKAVLLETGGTVQLFETSAMVSPFSFGNAIYFNRQLHTQEELQRIIQHEFVHVKQKHTVDLMVGELLCIVNWFNPFAWCIRHSIRQNLEFIADNNVVANGLDKKEYQYLLLKVVGVPQYSIASHFNFSNLKKRIAMMNKMKTPALHLTKFLFVLPLMAVLFLAFRKNDHEHNDKIPATAKSFQPNDTLPQPPPPPPLLPVVTDSSVLPVPVTPLLNQKGYILTIADNGGECVVIVKSKNQKIVKAITLTDWNKHQKENENQYGTIPPPPPPPPVPVLSALHADVLLKPLYFVDGIEKNSISGIYPEQIKSVDVLKNESAISKYGKRGENGVVEITTLAPLIIVDSVVQPENFNIKSIAPEKIERINVLSKSAKDKYGERARAGAVEISMKRDNQPGKPASSQPSVVWETSKPGNIKPDSLLASLKVADSSGSVEANIGKNSLNYFPKDVLVVIDGKEMPPGLNFSELASPNSIESMNILKGKDAVIAYGDKGKNGVIIIKSKHALQQNDKPLKITADTISFKKQQLRITGGRFEMEGKENVFNGDIHFGKKGTGMPMVFYNGKEVKAVAAFKAVNAKYSLLSLEKEQAIAKYGSRAKNGAVEITRL